MSYSPLTECQQICYHAIYKFLREKIDNLAMWFPTRQQFSFLYKTDNKTSRKNKLSTFDFLSETNLSHYTLLGIN